MKSETVRGARGPIGRARAPRSVGALGLALLLACVGCGGTEPDSDGAAELGAGDRDASVAADVPEVPTDAWAPRPLTLVPGDTLLDQVAAARLDGWPDSTLPADVRAAIEHAQGPEQVSIAADAWAGGKLVSDDVRRFMRIQRRVRRWRAEPGLTPRGAFAHYTLRHEGRELRRLHRPGKDGSTGGDPTWWDRTRDTLFIWQAGAGVLRVFGVEAPGAVELSVRDAPDRTLAALEWSFSEEAEERQVPSPGWLGRRSTLDRVSRSTLLLPAPASLSFDLDALAADRLRVAVGVVDHGLRVQDDVLVRAARAGDGVTFAVEARARGAADGTSFTRLWSRHVTPSAPFVEEAVDLSAWTGRDVTLRLVSEPGPAADASFDYAVWGALRLDAADAPAPDRPHIVLIDVDTLRADRLGVYGYERDTSPRLDAWAREHAFVYLDAVSTSSWTLPSTASILTGLAVQQHGVLDFPERLGPSTPPVSVLLRSAGYETWAMSDGGFVVPTFGFDAGFDRFDYRRDQFETLADPGWGAAVRFLESRGSARPVFLFLQTYLVHAPYPYDARFDDASEYDGEFAGDEVGYNNVIYPYLKGQIELDGEDREYASALYDAGVTRIDAVLDELLGALERVFAGQPYLVVITSDHGEEFFEHGKMNHGYSLYDEVLRVPLIVRFPDVAPDADLAGARRAGPRIGESTRPASTLDVVPTILDVAGLPIPEHLPGHSLVRELPDVRVRPSQQFDSLEAVHFDGFKLIVGHDETAEWAVEGLQPAGVVIGDEPVPVELYELRADPEESENLAEERRVRVERLRDLLDQFRQAYPRLRSTGTDGRAIDDDVIAELKELGYLGDH